MKTTRSLISTVASLRCWNETWPRKHCYVQQWLMHFLSTCFNCYRGPSLKDICTNGGGECRPPKTYHRQDKTCNNTATQGDGVSAYADVHTTVSAADFKNWQDCTDELFFSLTVMLAGCRHTLSMLTVGCPTHSAMQHWQYWPWPSLPFALRCISLHQRAPNGRSYLSLLTVAITT